MTEKESTNTWDECRAPPRAPPPARLPLTVGPMLPLHCSCCSHTCARASVPASYLLATALSRVKKESGVSPPPQTQSVQPAHGGNGACQAIASGFRFKPEPLWSHAQPNPITVAAVDGSVQVIHGGNGACQAIASGFQFTHASGTERTRRSQSP